MLKNQGKENINSEEDKISFQKLTPTNEVDLQIYDDAIDYVFENNDIKNIAISGSYSSGKSSLVSTYETKNKKKKFLHISLAHFNENEQNKNSKDNPSESTARDKKSKETETILEGKILNQLIQQIDPKKIPLTNFRIKKEMDGEYCRKMTWFIFTTIVCLCYFIFLSQWKGWVSNITLGGIKSLLSLTMTDSFAILSGLVLGYNIFIAIFQLVKAQSNRMLFKRFSLQGNEIELFTEDNDSYFDKYLNEVLYLFEHSRANAIVFEDIDRFDDILIFERLHEINRLINLRLKLENHDIASLRFFYLIRDDLFANKDRTKFFDFIIPVIPVVDSSNSYNVFKEYFKAGNLFDDFDEKFIRDLSLYVDDLRILKNIYNEFIIYYSKLKSIELDSNHMLSIITYKNIFPKDFSDLQLNQGFVFQCFEKKGDLIEKQLGEYEKKLEEAKERKSYFEKEHLTSLKELDWVKVGKRRDEYQEFFSWEKEQYPKRRRAIDDKLSKGLPELENNVKKIEREMVKVKNKPLANLITRENEDEFFRNIQYVNPIEQINRFEEVKTNEYFNLLKFLISHGYINETYNDYLSFFYDNSISKNDKIFLRSVTDRKAKEYNYKIKNIRLVMEFLHIEDFAEEETMNFDLFENLLKTEAYSEQRKLFATQLRQNKCYQFVSEFYNAKTCHKELVELLADEWCEFLTEIILKEEWNSDQTRQFSVDTLLYTDLEHLEMVNKDNVLTEYISGIDDYMSIENDICEKIAEALIKLDVKFLKINAEKSNKVLFDTVYENSLYQINMENILLMLSERYKIPENENSNTKCVSNIFSANEEPLRRYVADNMNLFMKILIETGEETFYDAEKYVLMVINRSDISEEYIKEYVERAKILISNIESINKNEYKQKLITLGKLQYTMHNIFAYYKVYGLDEEIIGFVNSRTCKLESFQIDKIDNDISSFWEACVTCEKLDNDKYREIVNNFGLSFEKFNIKGIAKDKMDILIQEQVIPMTKDILDFIRDNYPENVVNYILSDIKEYSAIAVGTNANLNEILEIIQTDVSIEIKLKILEETKEKISVQDKKYDDEVMIHILKNNFQEADFLYLCNNFLKFIEPVKNQIVVLSENRVSNIINNIEQIDKNLLLLLINNTNINKDNKIKLFTALPFQLETDELIKWLQNLDCPEIAKIFMPNKRPKVEINSINKKVMEELFKKEYISSYDEDSETNSFRQIRH